MQGIIGGFYFEFMLYEVISLLYMDADEMYSLICQTGLIYYRFDSEQAVKKKRTVCSICLI